MNTAKLVNSALTGGGLIYPENLNVIIGSESKGYPKGTVLDANATLSLAGSNGTGNNGSNPTSSNLDKYLKINTVLEGSDNTGNKFYSKSLNMLSDKENNYLSIDLQNKEYSSDISLNYISGSANLNLGSINILLGKNNIGVGTGIYSTNEAASNILLGNRVAMQVSKNPGGKLRLIVKKGSVVEYQLKEGLLGITDRFAIVKNDKKYSFKEISNTNVLTRMSNNFTRIDDDIIEMNNVKLDKLNECDYVVAYSVTSNGKNNILCGTGVFVGGSNSIIVGHSLYTSSSTNKYPNYIQCFGLRNKVSNNCEFASGAYNVSNNKTVGNYQFNTVFSIGAGSLENGNLNALELISKKNTADNTSINALYINGIGGYDGTNVSDDNAKSLQQVISDIQSSLTSTTHPAVDNGPWDIDITSRFINGNVTIKPLSPWTINTAYKRVYFEADLKQGDIITIPDSLRMYIGWKISDNRFGMADWTTAGKKYTVTTDSKYVILLDTPTADAPGVQVDTLSSFGKIMLHTSNAAFKPNPGSGSQTVVLPKDHTRDDRVMKSIAHQGYHATEKANSLAAFKAAAKEGWQYVETDIYKTSDNNWVVGHDAWMPEGYTNGTITIASGDHSYKYEEHTLAEIKAFTSPDNNKVATLQEFCKVCKQGGLHPYIEIKNPNMGGKQTGVGDKYDNRPYVHKALDIIKREGLGKNFTIISSGNWNLEETVKYDNNIRVGYINVFEMYNVGTDVNKKYWDTVTINLTKIINAGMGRAVYLFLDQNLTHVATCPAENMDWLMDKKIALEVWTAKTANDLDNLDPYITGVTCDNIHAGEILAKKI